MNIGIVTERRNRKRSTVHIHLAKRVVQGGMESKELVKISGLVLKSINVRDG